MNLTTDRIQNDVAVGNRFGEVHSVIRNCGRSQILNGADIGVTAGRNNIGAYMPGNLDCDRANTARAATES